MAVDYEKKNGISYVTINNPSKANILDRETSNEISEIWKEIWEDPDVRAVILTGVGDRHFCAGHNLDTRPDVTQEERERIRSENIFWPLGIYSNTICVYWIRYITREIRSAHIYEVGCAAV